MEALSSIASALAQVGYFNDALAVLGLREYDEYQFDKFVRTLARWAPFFGQVKQGLSADVLREATAVAGWVRLDWRKIHELLSLSRYCNETQFSK
jgi:hypothetical protein